LGLGLVLAGTLACKKVPDPYPVGTGPTEDGSAPSLMGAGGTGGIVTSGGGLTTGAAGFDAGAPNGTVVIAIQSPAADTLLSVNAAADVAAKITMSMGATDVVDPSTVRASLVPMGVAGSVSAAPLVGPTGMNLFSGKLSLAGLGTGDYVLTVTASSSAGVSGSASINVKIDGGPRITVISPIAGHHYKGGLIIQAFIDPGDFGPATNVQCSIAGTPIMLTPTGTGTQFRGVFELSMPVALTGDQVFEVSAKDNKGTTTDLKFLFNVDITGPVIASPLPAPGSITGQVIRIAANISDGAGLDASSIQVLIGDKTNPQFKLPLTLDQMGAYSALFDTKQLTSCKLASNSLCIVRPTLSFRAADALGNETTLSYEIAVDNIPPIADLTPPPLRVSKVGTDGLWCSFAFDPLSNDIYNGDAPDDGCRVPQMFDLRARIQDTGNNATGIKGAPIAGIDPDVTAAYILADTSQPLVVDNDGDGFCDVINPKLVPTTTPLTGPRQVLKVRLRPVPPAGNADFRKDVTVPPVCLPGEDLIPPIDICKMENPKVAISYAGGLPAIWAVEPIAPDNPNYCFGSQLDTLANNVPEAGWRCIAVATGDKNGNLSTSMPIRVWVDYGYQGSFDWCLKPPPSAPPPPSCTGSFDKTSDTVSPKACTARKFQPGEICFNNDC
jgi:hypothetical protein